MIQPTSLLSTQHQTEDMCLKRIASVVFCASILVACPALAQVVHDAGAFVGAPGGYDAAAVVDFNGDAKAAILLRHNPTGDVGLWLMNDPVITAGSFVSSLDTSYGIVP